MLRKLPNGLLPSGEFNWRGPQTRRRGRWHARTGLVSPGLAASRLRTRFQSCEATIRVDCSDPSSTDRSHHRGQRSRQSACCSVRAHICSPDLRKRTSHSFVRPKIGHAGDSNPGPFGLTRGSFFSGLRSRNRTCDTWSVNPLLYPTELSTLVSRVIDRSGKHAEDKVRVPQVGIQNRLRWSQSSR